MPRVLGAGHDPKQPDLVFLSLRGAGRHGADVTRFYLDPDDALTVIRVLAAAVQKTMQEDQAAS